MASVSARPVPITAQRRRVEFASGRETCVAWHYPGASSGCVVMAAGGGVTKEPGTDAFAAAFHGAGLGVLAFDYRRLGESGGDPRQLIRIREQLADWQAAIEHARAIEGVDPSRIAVWGYSLTAGHVFAVAARDPTLAAAIAHAPLADGPAATARAMRHQTPLAALRLTGRGALDAIGGRFGRPPRLVPIAAAPGTVAMLTTPDSLDADRALKRSDYPDWQQEIAARSALRIAFYRPGRFARRASCPLLVVVHEGDQSALAAPAVRAARRAPRGQLLRLPGGHYGGYLDQHDQAVRGQLEFLWRHLALSRSGEIEGHLSKSP